MFAFTSSKLQKMLCEDRMYYYMCDCNVLLHVSHLEPVYIILQHSRPTFSKLSQADFHCDGCNKNEFFMFLVICVSMCAYVCVRMCVYVLYRMCCIDFMFFRRSLFCKRKHINYAYKKKYHMEKTLFSSRFGLYNMCFLVVIYMRTNLN